MRQILQSYRTGELWLAEVPVPACDRLGVGSVDGLENVKPRVTGG